MVDILKGAFGETVRRIKKSLKKSPIERINESVFRFMYSEVLAELAPDIKQFEEADRIDLVLHRGSERAFIEFKFYIRRRRHYPLSGEERGWKGGPGQKNYEEFQKCIKTLRRRYRDFGILKLVALFYSDPADTNLKKYCEYYGVRPYAQANLEDLNIERRDSIEPFEIRNCKCNAKLFEVLG